MKITKRQAMGIVRHLLTFLGGVIVIVGWSDNHNLILEMVGSGVALFGSIWSVIEKS